VTALNIEAGEFAFVGAFNNPATVLLTVADLDVIEALVEVDESQAVQAKPGESSELEVDAHADWVFKGVVTEVGHTPVTKQTGGEREGTSYMVKILVQDRIPGVRPGLTCSAKIRTDARMNVVAVPIQALTLRKPMSESLWKKGPAVEGPSTALAAEPPAAPEKKEGAEKGAKGGEPAAAERLAGSNATRRQDDEGKVEGLLYVKDGRAWFQPVKLGITGEKDFELVNSGGLEEGAEIIVGPYKALRTLKDGDRVRQAEKKEGEGSNG